MFFVSSGLSLWQTNQALSTIILWRISSFFIHKFQNEPKLWFLSSSCHMNRLLVFRINSWNKKEGGMKNSFRKWCVLLCSNLFEDTWGFGKTNSLQLQFMLHKWLIRQQVWLHQCFSVLLNHGMSTSTLRGNASAPSGLVPPFPLPRLAMGCWQLPPVSSQTLWQKVRNCHISDF